MEIAAMGCGSSLQGQGQPKGQGQGQPSKGKRGGRASVIEAEAGLACLEINAFSEKKQLGDEAMNFSRPFFFRIGFFSMKKHIYSIGQNLIRRVPMFYRVENLSSGSILKLPGGIGKHEINITLNAQK